MAAPCSQNRVRIRIAETTLSENNKIQPFWHLVHLDSCPLVSNVEEKILSILNSMILRSTNDELIQPRASTINSTFSTSSASLNNGQNVGSSSKHMKHSCVNRDVSSAIFNLEHDLSLKKTIDLEQLELDLSTENKTGRQESEKESSAEKSERAKIISCQLWMEGFLLLSSERSEIFQDGDLVSVRCVWCLNGFKSGIDFDDNANNDDSTAKSVQKKKRKKRKHHDSMNLTQSFNEISEISKVHDDTNDSIKDSRKTNGICEISENNNSAKSQESPDTPPKKKSKRKKTKDTKIEREEETLGLSNVKGKVDLNVPLCGDGITQAPMLSHGDHVINCADETIERNSDLLTLLNQKIEELSENQVKSDTKFSNVSGVQNTESERNDISFNKQEEIKLPDQQKRKRQRKRKKKSNETVVKETQMKAGSIKDNRPRSSTLKLLTGHKPENVRLTFASDSENEEVSTHAATDDNDLKEKQKGVATASSSSFPIQNEESAVLIKKLNQSCSESLPVTNTTMRTDRVSITSAHAGKSSSSPDKAQTVPFAQGQSLDPNSKFDELLKRRRLTGSNCSVDSLGSGAYIFTRERQRGRNQHRQNVELPTHHMHSVSTLEENSLHPVRQSVTAVKKDGLDNVQTTSSFASEMPCHSTSDKVEVTPLYLDVERCKPLEGVPQSGDIIAYKILELSEDYTPVLSSFKQGQVLSCEDSMVHIELMESSVPTKRTGRFELLYEEQEEEEKEESCNNLVSVELGAMVDARLVQRSPQKTGKSM